MTTNLGHSSLLRPVRDRLGRWLHARIEAIVDARLEREMAAERDARLSTPGHWGPGERLHIADTAVINDALLNTVSGSITVEDHAFFGHGVALLTGTHDISRTGLERQQAVPTEGRDIVVGPGAWIASRAIVLGPCRVGANAVIAAGSLVSADVPPGAIVAGAPARLVGRVQARPALPPNVTLMTDVGTLSAHPQDEVITPYLRQHGCWEEDDRRWLEAELTPGAVAVDVGANIGYMTLAAAQAVGPGGTVIAVEPHPDNLALLHANLDRNGVASRVRVIGAAAWDTTGVVDLAECDENTGDHRVQTLQSERSVLSVDAVRLDDVIPEDLHVAVIKLDTQATEHRVLAGATALLARDRPVILSEFWPQGLRERGDDPLAILAEFRRLGYEIEVPDEPASATLDDAALTDSIHARSAGRFGGFATLRLHPRA
jgi:FkbM family methyltransferase